MNFIKKTTLVTLFAALMAAGSVVLHTSAIAEDSSECIATDLKGSLQYVDDHSASSPVHGTFDNIAQNPDCSDTVTLHVFGSNVAPSSANWLESQTHLFSQSFEIPQGSTGFPVELNIPESGYCWYQVDATRTTEVRIPPVYHGNDMIDYVFVQGSNCGQNEVTPTPTCNENSCTEVDPTATPTPPPAGGPTPTPTNTPNVGGSNESTNSNTGSTESTSASQTLGATTLAPTGDFASLAANIGLVTGFAFIASSVVLKSRSK